MSFTRSDSGHDPVRGPLHDEVFKLLPWYHNGTLEDVEAARVNAHLSECPLCRDELAHCAEISETVTDEREAAWQPGEQNLNRILDRIASEQGQARPAEAVGWSERFASWIDWTFVPKPARWALVAQSLAIVALLAFFSLPRTPESPRFETLTAQASEGLDRPDVQIVFREDTLESDLRNLLQSVDAEIVSGPSKRGVYKLALASSASLATALQVLRADPHVRFADALAGSGTR